MPPRYAYWTILIDNQPTAFRAREREELLPTFNQLARKNRVIAMKWFARGRLWDSPEAERAAQQKPRVPFEKRNREWRPGGEHRDPRARFDNKKIHRPHRSEEPRGERSGKPEALRPLRPAAGKPIFRPAKPDVAQKPGVAQVLRPAKPGDRPRSDRPWRDNKSGGAGGARPWSNKPPGAGGGERRPWINKPPDAGGGKRRSWDDKPPSGDRPSKDTSPKRGGDRPWRDKKPGGASDARPWSGKPPRGAGGTRPWSSKPPGGGADRRPWQDKPREPRKPKLPEDE